jgi:hypothetical protein
MTEGPGGSADLAVPLELEAGYEETCRVLRIR